MGFLHTVEFCCGILLASSALGILAGYLDILKQRAYYSKLLKEGKQKYVQTIRFSRHDGGECQ
jgi:hypothetical protein